MTLPDTINGSFELFGGVVNIFNIRAILRDQQVRGVSWGVTAFFVCWGLWNLFYYPHLHQWASFIGGMVLVGTNIIWTMYAIRLALLEGVG